MTIHNKTARCNTEQRPQPCAQCTAWLSSSVSNRRLWVPAHFEAIVREETTDVRVEKTIYDARGSTRGSEAYARCPLSCANLFATERCVLHLTGERQARRWARNVLICPVAWRASTSSASGRRTREQRRWRRWGGHDHLRHVLNPQTCLQRSHRGRRCVGSIIPWFKGNTSTGFLEQKCAFGKSTRRFRCEHDPKSGCIGCQIDGRLAVDKTNIPHHCRLRDRHGLRRDKREHVVTDACPSAVRHVDNDDTVCSVRVTASCVPSFGIRPTLACHLWWWRFRWWRRWWRWRWRWRRWDRSGSWFLKPISACVIHELVRGIV